jgi:hypothetical protein
MTSKRSWISTFIDTKKKKDLELYQSIFIQKKKKSSTVRSKLCVGHARLNSIECKYELLKGGKKHKINYLRMTSLKIQMLFFFNISILGVRCIGSLRWYRWINRKWEERCSEQEFTTRLQCDRSDEICIRDSMSWYCFLCRYNCHCCQGFCCRGRCFHDSFYMCSVVV